MKALLTQALDALTQHGCPWLRHEKEYQAAVDALREELDKPTYKPYVPTCACCGTTENLHIDRGSGGPYRCNSPDCMVF